MSAPIERVVVLMTDRPEPVYHRFGTVSQTGVGQWVATVQCGKTEDDYRWWSACLRRDHADLFARQCRRCFPA